LPTWSETSWTGQKRSETAHRHFSVGERVANVQSLSAPIPLSAVSHGGSHWFESSSPHKFSFDSLPPRCLASPKPVAAQTTETFTNPPGRLVPAAARGAGDLLRARPDAA